jgi:hypothetical protein
MLPVPWSGTIRTVMPFETQRRRGRPSGSAVRSSDDPGMAELRSRNLLPRIIAELGVTRQAANAWCRVPLKRVIDVSRITGIPLSKLRPDFYGPKAISVIAAKNDE